MDSPALKSIHYSIPELIISVHLEEKGDITFKFSYGGYNGEIWEASNSRGYHFWVVSI
jgi:hypothetical protein